MAMTDAPSTGCWLGPMTRPASEPVVTPCAAAPVAKSATANNDNANLVRCFMYRSMESA